MKIKTLKTDYEKVAAIEPPQHKKPKKPNILFRTLVRIASMPDLWATGVKYRKIGMEKLGKKQPCLILMNHSSFLDLKMASKMLYPRPYNIICTYDGLVGKEWLMRNIGCVPTVKFVSDLTLIRDMVYSLRKLKCSVLMYPEAGYSFDGKTTVLPDSLGKCLKLLGVPVVMITTYGAFARDPLYNGLRLRKVKVTADMEYLLSPEEIAEKSADELNEILRKAFSFDNFRWQQENKVKIDEKFRATGLERVLYKCPHCMKEGRMLGEGTKLTCRECGKTYELDEYGYLRAEDGDGKFDHVPDWFEWQRECVRREIEQGSYLLDTPVDIAILKGTKCLYMVGEGNLRQDENGFRLAGFDGRLNYEQKPIASHSLNADYFWYEIGDVISIGDGKTLYYCFPKDGNVSVAKARLATEELYKIKRKRS